MLDIKHRVVWSQTGLVFLTWVHTCLLIAWAVCGIITGFANGILHVAPLAVEIFLMKLSSDTLGFSVDCTQKEFFLDVKQKYRMIILVCVILFVALALNIVHGIFGAIELRDCTTPLCVDTYWVLLIFTCIVFFLVIWEAIEFYYFVKYYFHLESFAKILKRE